MDIKTASNRITNSYSLFQSQQLTQATYIQEEEIIRISISLLYVEGTSEKLWHILKSHKIRSTTLKTLCVNSIVNQKIEQLQKIKIQKIKTLCVNSIVNQKIEQLQKIKIQKIKTVLFMKLTVVTAKQFFWRI